MTNLSAFSCALAFKMMRSPSFARARSFSARIHGLKMSRFMCKFFANCNCFGLRAEMPLP